MSEKRWFLLDGSEVELLGKCAAGCIVGRIYEDEEGCEPRYAKPFYVDAVYDFEYFQKEHPDVVLRRQQIAELNEKLIALRAEIQAAEKSRPAILARLKQIPALEALEDVIEDRITHFVHEDYCHTTVVDRSMLDYKENGRDCHPKKFRLLSLYGSSRGDLEFNIHEYCDGSGNSRYQVWPFKSREAAVSFAHLRLLDRLADTTSNRDPKYLLDSFEKCGIDAPAELVAAVAASKESQRLEHIKKLQEELDKLHAEAKAKAKAVNPEVANG